MGPAAAFWFAVCSGVPHADRPWPANTLKGALMQVTKKWIVLPATLALGVSSLTLAQTNRDDERREDREARQRQQERERDQRREDKQTPRGDRRSDAQPGIERVRQAVQERYRDAKVTQIGTAPQNGVQTYLVRVETDQGETSARATERGDFLFLGYPGVSYDRLPRPVSSVIEGMFNGKPETVQKYENTTYLVNADFGGKSYQVQLNAVGRLLDAKPSSEVKREDPSQFPRASRSDEDSLQPRLKDYFRDPKVKSVHRYPDAEGFFWVNLSTSTEDDVWVLMDAKREVAEYRTRVSGNDVPQPVTQAMREFFKGAKTDVVYRNNEILYNVLQPVGNEAVLLQITPLGDVNRIRQADAGDIRREFAEREPDELFRARDQQRGQRVTSDRNNDNDNNRSNSNNRNNNRNDR
jgi:hypothetical protein